MKYLVLFLLVVGFVMGLTAQSVKAQESRIITGSGVRVRREPDTSAQEISRLSLGTIVGVSGRSEAQETIGDMQDYWYQIVLEDGQQGWVFGSLTRPFELAKRTEIYRDLMNARLRHEGLNFSDLIDFFHFLTRAAEEVTEPEAVAELKFTRLIILDRSLLKGKEEHASQLKAWITEQQGLIYYHESAGRWYVQSSIYWDLHANYHSLPLADDIAWEAAQNPLPGECEGYLPCDVSRLNQSVGKYLEFYPKGAHSAEALVSITNDLHWFVKNTEEKYARNDFLMLKRELTRLQRTIEKTQNPTTTAVLQQIEQIRQLHLTQK